jgi:hypothetical protein
MNFITCVKTIIHAKNELYNHFNILSYRHFKTKKKHLELGLTLKYRSKVKHEYISGFLGYFFQYPVNTIFRSKTNSKEVIEHENCDFSC